MGIGWFATGMSYFTPRLKCASLPLQTAKPFFPNIFYQAKTSFSTIIGFYAFTPAGRNMAESYVPEVFHQFRQQGVSN